MTSQRSLLGPAGGTELPVSDASGPERTRIAAIKREIVATRQSLTAVKDQIAQCQADIAAQKALLGSVLTDTQRLQAVAEDRKSTIGLIHSSSSWKVTAPLRRASMMFRNDDGLAAFDASPPSPSRQARSPGAASSVQRRSRRSEGRRGLMLVAADILPLFDQSSGGLRLKTLIDLMGEAGWAMAFGSVDKLGHQVSALKTEAGRTHYEDALRAAGVGRFLYGVDAIAGFLAETGREVQRAFLSFPHVAAELSPLVRRFCPTARIIYDMVDFHGLRLAREAALADDPLLRAEAARQRMVEISCARNTDITVAVTEEERAAVLEAAPEVVVETLPNIFLSKDTPISGPENRDGLLFVGGFWHSPNGDAMAWFVEHIFPIVRREIPGLVLRIVGANPENELLALGTRPGVEVLGFMPDLVPVFARSRVFVAPLRFGAGMKGKVGQSLVEGLPVVTTSVGAEGMGLQAGKHVLIAETEQDFADCIVALVRSDDLWWRLAAAGRAHIEATLSVDVARAKLETILGG